MTVSLSVDVRQVDALADRWQRNTFGFGVRVYGVVQKHGRLLHGRVKQHASLPRTAARASDVARASRSSQAGAFAGVPQLGMMLATSNMWQGVRLLTGGYNRSITLVTYIDGGTIGAAVGTNDERGRRLELGFVGVDSLGRHYNQPPYVHFAPALAETEPGFRRDLADAAVAGLP